MARVIEIIDVDSTGYRVRLDTGEAASLHHLDGSCPTIGEEVSGAAEPQSNMPITADPSPAPDSTDEPPASDPAAEV